MEFFYKTKKFSKIFFRNSLKTQRFLGKNWRFVDDRSQWIPEDWATVAQIQFAHRHLPKIFCPIFICSFGHLLKWNLLKMEKTFAHEDTCSISCFNYDLPRNPWIFQPKSMLVCNLYLDRRVAFCFVVMQ